MKKLKANEKGNPFYELKPYLVMRNDIQAVINGAIPLLYIVGEPGLGKTYQVDLQLERLTKNTQTRKPKAFIFSEGYNSPLSFYQTLFQHKDKEIIVFHDLEGVDDKKTINILKGLFGSKKVRWGSTSETLAKLSLPEEFDISARVIFTANYIPPKFEAVLSRGMLCNLDLTYEEKIIVFDYLVYKRIADEDVVKYIKQKTTPFSKGLDIRKVISLSKYKKQGNNYELKIDSMFADTGEPLEILYKLITEENAKNPSKRLTGKQLQEKWSEKTGKEKSAYYEHIKKLRLISAKFKAHSIVDELEESNEM